MFQSYKAIHHFILDMEKQTLVNLKVGIRSYAKIMAVHSAKRPIEVAGQIINGAYTNFPRIENTVAYLWRNGQTKMVARHTETETAAINHLPLHVRHIGKELGRSLASIAQKHQDKGRNDCKSFHFQRIFGKNTIKTVAYRIQ